MYFIDWKQNWELNENSFKTKLQNDGNLKKH